jgi:hypothetical protein
MQHTVDCEKMKYEQCDVLWLGSVTVVFLGTVRTWLQERGLAAS